MRHIVSFTLLSLLCLIFLASCSRPEKTTWIDVNQKFTELQQEQADFMESTKKKFMTDNIQAK